MRIAHVLPTNFAVTTDFGGAIERRALAMADQQSSLGHDVVVFSAGEPVPIVRDSGARIVPVDTRLNRPLRDLEYLFRVRSRLMAGNRADVVHSHSQPLSGTLLRGGARAVIGQFDNYFFRGTANSMVRRAYARALKNFSRVTAVSSYTARAMSEYFSIKQISVLYNGVDMEHFTPSATLQPGLLDLPDPDGSGFVLYAGRINEQKGSDLLPLVAAAIAGTGLRMVAVGPFEQFGRAPNTKAAQQMLGEVTYLGAVHDNDLPGIMAAASLLLLPTRRLEMFGMVLIEAGACGTPCVATDLGGIPEAVGEGGVLVPVDDWTAMSEAIMSVCSNPDRLASLSERARANAVRFSWETVTEHSLRIYNECLAESSG